MLNQKLRSIFRFGMYAFLGMLLHGNVALAAETADEAVAKEQITAIQTLGDSDNTEALKRLLSIKQKQTSATPLQVRLDTVKVLVDLYYDAGKIKSSTAAINEFLTLATA